MSQEDVNVKVGDMIQYKSHSNTTHFDLGRCSLLHGLVERAYLTVIKAHSRRMVWTFYQAIILVTLLTLLVHPCSAHYWEKPECTKVGHIREEKIANCVMFNITLNVCRGFCLSVAYPSPSRTLYMNSNHLITSRSECCNIRKTHDVQAYVKCFDVNGTAFYRTFTYKSAETCSCSICKNDNYQH